MLRKHTLNLFKNNQYWNYSITMLNNESELCLYIYMRGKKVFQSDTTDTATEFIPVYHGGHKALLWRIFSRDKVKVANSYLNEVISDIFSGIYYATVALYENILLETWIFLGFHRWYWWEKSIQETALYSPVFQSSTIPTKNTEDTGTVHLPTAWILHHLIEVTRTQILLSKITI